MNKDYHWSSNPEGMSLDEIAKELNLTRNQVRGTLQHALLKLRLHKIAKKYKTEDFLDN